MIRLYFISSSPDYFTTNAGSECRGSGGFGKTEKLQIKYIFARSKMASIERRIFATNPDKKYIEGKLKMLGLIVNRCCI